MMQDDAFTSFILPSSCCRALLAQPDRITAPVDAATIVLKGHPSHAQPRFDRDRSIRISGSVLSP